MILVDDGSTDGSEKICDNYSRQYSNIKTIYKSNSGLSSARNLGIREAKCDWITVVDSNDRLKQNALEFNLKDLPLKSVIAYMAIRLGAGRMIRRFFEW